MSSQPIKKERRRKPFDHESDLGQENIFHWLSSKVLFSLHKRSFFNFFWLVIRYLLLREQELG